MLKIEVGTIKIQVFRQELFLYLIKKELKVCFLCFKVFFSIKCLKEVEWACKLFLEDGSSVETL